MPSQSSDPRTSGLLHLEEQKYREALVDFATAIEVSPNDADLHFFAATAHAGLDERADAIRCFERALETSPAHAPALFGLIDLHRAADDSTAAIEVFRRYEAHIPDSEAKQKYADLLEQWNEGRADQQAAIDVARAAEQQIRKAEDMLMQHRPAEALACLQAVLDEHPDNAHALNDAGHAYVELGQTVEACQSFERALEVDPGHQSAFYSLLDLLVRAEAPDLAVDVLLRHHEHMPDDSEKAKYAAALNDWAEKQAAKAASGDSLPGEVSVSVPDFAEPSSADGLRIAIVCGPDRKFITDIESGLRERGHAVHPCYFDSQVDLDRIQRAMDWADVTWFEWCDRILVHASQKLRKTSAVVCRLHRYEAFSAFPAQVNWSFVDRLVLPSPHMHRLFEARHPAPVAQVPIEVVTTGIDLDRYSFVEREPGFNLAYLGYLHDRKNPALLLQCMHALVREDDRYRLHIAGYHQQPVWELYFEHMLDALNLRDYVVMSGWVENVEDWLKDKSYLISTSIHEGNPYGIPEAVARGLKPLIHNFVDAEDLYPREWLFDTVDEFVAKVVERSFEPQTYRAYIEKHYDIANKVEQVDSLMRRLAAIARDTPHSASLNAGSPAESPDDRSNAGVDRCQTSNARDLAAPASASLQQARAFYDEWGMRLVGDYERGNPRVRAALAFTINQLPHDAASILDIGCGVGWSGWEFARHFRQAHIVGVDLSEALINIAQQLFQDERLSFFAGDITEAKTVPGAPFDAVVLLDVYEHIPMDQRAALHAFLDKVLRADGHVVLSCPSPHLQAFLKENAPHKLQPVDEIVTLDHLQGLARDLGGEVTDFGYVSIWQANDYFHARISRSTTTQLPLVKAPPVRLEDDATRATRARTFMQGVLSHA